MRTRTSDLTGPALDWAVAKCEGRQMYIQNGEMWFTDSGTHPDGIETDYGGWILCGPIIEREEIDTACTRENLWEAQWWDGRHHSTNVLKTGPTPLVAAMRCYVASKLGDEVEVPEELK